MKRNTVLCLGLTPAVQRTMIFDAVQMGAVNRATQIVQSAAGKAVNVAVALTRLGDSAVVTGFNGGATGAIVEQTLLEQGVRTAFSKISWSTRICTTVVDKKSKTVTEFVEEAASPPKAVWEHFAQANDRWLGLSVLLIISGTLPPNVADHFYVQFAQKAVRKNLPWIIDSHKGGLLKTLYCNPLLAKLNVHELERTLNVSCTNEKAILKNAARLADSGAEWVLVTQGAEAAYLVSRGGQNWKYMPPKVNVVNPIGSGDCVTAGLAHCLMNKKSMPDAVRCGLACGSAGAATLMPGDFDAKLAAQLVKTTDMKRLP